MMLPLQVPVHNPPRRRRQRIRNLQRVPERFTNRSPRLGII
jgi:hypothetical protein